MVFTAFNPRRKTHSLGHLRSSLSFVSIAYSIYIFVLILVNASVRKTSARANEIPGTKENKYVIPLEVTSERCTVNGAE